MPVFSALKPSYEPAPMPTVAEEPADLAALARTVAEHAPSLQFIALDMSGAPGAAKDAQAWFRAYSAGSERKVVKVEEAEGRATMRKMLAMNRWD